MNTGTTAYFDIANPSLGIPIVGAQENDFLLRTDRSNQKIFLATGSNVTPAAVFVRSNVGIGGIASPQFTLDVNGDVNFSGGLYQSGQKYIGSQWTTNSGSNAIYIISSNVGIGTTSPSFPLDVAGSINFTGSLFQNGQRYIGSQWTTNTLSNSISITSSNVGIGTTTPSNTLHVAGTTRFDGGIVMMNQQMSITRLKLLQTQVAGTIANITSLVNSVSGIDTQNSASAFKFTLSNPQTQFQFQDASSNNYLTVNTTSGLTVTDTTGSIGTNLSLNKTGNNNTPAFFSFYKSRGTSATPVGIAANDIYGSIDYYGHDGTSFRQVAQIQTFTDTAATTDNIGAQLVFSTRSTGTASTLQQRMVIQPTLTTLNTALNLTSNLNVDGTTVITKDRTLSNVSINASAINSGTLAVSYGGTGANTLTTNKLLVGNGTSAVLTPANLHWDNTNFYLGINNTLPSCSLVVQQATEGRGNTKFTSLSSTSNDNWWLGFTASGLTTDANDVARIGVRLGTTGNLAGNIYFTTGASNAQQERMRITENGNIGINNSNPGEALDVNGKIRVNGTNAMLTLQNNSGTSTNSAFMLFYNANQTAGAALGIDGPNHMNITSGATALTSTTNNDLILGTVNTERMRIKTSGDVGIGTANPSYKLHVVGDIYTTGDITAFSDARVKTDLEKLENCLTKLQTLTGYRYTRSDVKSNRKHIGLIAQEVEQIAPELIYENNEGYKGIAYPNMAALFVEAFKEITERLNTLADKVENICTMLQL